MLPAVSGAESGVPFALDASYVTSGDAFLFEPSLHPLVVSQMCPHQALPQAPTISSKEVQQFMDDNVVA
jgi:hypothetical protein